MAGTLFTIFLGPLSRKLAKYGAYQFGTLSVDPRQPKAHPDTPPRIITPQKLGVADDAHIELATGAGELRALRLGQMAADTVTAREMAAASINESQREAASLYMKVAMLRMQDQHER